MLHRYRFALRPGWWVLHVFTIAMVVTMVLLGRWQLTVSEAKHFNIRNFGYALQWWAFSAFALVMWARILRDQVSHPEGAAPAPVEEDPALPPPVTYRRYVPPQAVEAEDDVQAAYNAYLAHLNRNGRS